MTEFLDTWHYLPHFQLLIVVLFFFALWPSIEEIQPQPLNSPEENPPNVRKKRTEENPQREPKEQSGELSLKQCKQGGKFGAPLTLNPETGKTNFVEVNYKA